MRYKIEFFSYWHCGSGQTAGADVDELVVRDASGLPFVPGRTLKGLLREAVANILLLRGDEEGSVEELFGSESRQGRLYFTNASMSDALRRSLRSTPDIDPEMLYRSLSSTAIDERGVAKEHTLRRIETAIPCTLYGEITGIGSADEEALLVEALKYVKRLGLGRSRGYGRCELSRIDD